MVKTSLKTFFVLSIIEIIVLTEIPEYYMLLYVIPFQFLYVILKVYPYIYIYISII